MFRLQELMLANEKLRLQLENGERMAAGLSRTSLRDGDRGLSTSAKRPRRHNASATDDIDIERRLRELHNYGVTDEKYTRYSMTSMVQQ